MNGRGRIAIDGSRVLIEPGPDGQIWLSRWELAELFGVYTATITANIKAIIRSGAVKPSLDGTVMMMGNTPIPELVRMEMIVALAFRIDSPVADTFRKWIIGKVVANPFLPVRSHIIISCGPAKGVN